MATSSPPSPSLSRSVKTSQNSTCRSTSSVTYPVLSSTYHTSRTSDALETLSQSCITATSRPRTSKSPPPRVDNSHCTPCSTQSHCRVCVQRRCLLTRLTTGPAVLVWAHCSADTLTIWPQTSNSVNTATESYQTQVSITKHNVWSTVSSRRTIAYLLVRMRHIMYS